MAHHDEHASSHSDGSVPLYCRPVQRQKWGEAQIQPHTNWGDTFFDLFYVAGAYNLGNLLKVEPTSRGFLYFVGCFYPLQVVWNQKMYYDARIWNPEDVYHKLYEFAILVALATAVLYVRPVAILSDPKNHIDMFVFALSIAIANVMASGRTVELYFKGVGQPALKKAARRDFIWSMVINVWYIAAAFVAGLEYYGNIGNDSGYHTEDDHVYTIDDSSNTTYEDDNHRVLAASESSGSDYYPVYENNLPIWLLVGGSISFTVGLSVMVLFLPRGGKHKEISIPMNVTFATHRWGEFTMLMLGESILSLLIVDVTGSRSYYKTFFSGIISITLLEFLHFRSQPHDADDHALRRSKEAGVTFTALMQIYSAALLVLGTSYKMLLYEYIYESKETGDHRLLLSPLTRLLERVLAGSDAPMFEMDERRQRVAHFFCFSMAIVWLCSDLMIINHKGLKDNLGACRFTHTGRRKILAIVLVVFRIGMVALIATLGEYVTQPSVLAFVGLIGIIAQVILRVIGSSFFGTEFEHDSHDHDSSMWPNVTKPQVEEEAAK